MLKRIEDHVLEKSRSEAAKLLDEAQKKADAEFAAARDEAARKLKAAIDRLQAELHGALDREVSGLRAARDREILTTKSRVLDDAFTRAAERLLESPAYWNLVRRRLRELAGQKGEILCRAEHRATVTKYVDELNRETGGTIPPLAAESAEILGGFILRGERVDVDFTLESELAVLRERILPQLAARAFGNT